MQIASGTFHHAWPILTRFGDSAILLPCAVLLAGWVGLRSRMQALAWLLPLAVAVLLTTASKIAFIGFGIGSAALDFTGFSGHAMFAAAVHPMLAFSTAANAPRPWRGVAVAVGYAVAVLVAVSRFQLGHHSASECVAGFALGAAASAITLRRVSDPGRPAFASVAVALVVLWAALSLAPRAPVLPSHAMVTWVALQLGGRDAPFTREDLHRRAAAPS
ncbi:MAG TPA: phosphatase PAP2 family protein [Ramlibacter sp.]|jgi:membrane-associated phospholipid phosphatase|uniref:phosphatase PAP2 family protein n=1 Tax=Ramlibacter sp. TaxID=1917967 RepID=UPI002D3663EA|nr:phosphatase PAP2 family protein [Ramlibacter sp.]HZY18037.1 phosphatase PAP2 family protein [Ramlibacter sp.]